MCPAASCSRVLIEEDPAHPPLDVAQSDQIEFNFDDTPLFAPPHQASPEPNGFR